MSYHYSNTFPALEPILLFLFNVDTPLPFYLCIFVQRQESINSDLPRGLDRRLRHTTLNTERKQLAIKVSADN